MFGLICHYLPNPETWSVKSANNLKSFWKCFRKNLRNYPERCGKIEGEDDFDESILINTS